MTILDPAQTEREERSLRIAKLLIITMVVVVTAACIFFLYLIVVPSPTRYALGPAADFPTDVPVERNVPELSISTFIELRPKVSQDIVFVTHKADGSWLGLLGVDTDSGCFLRWDEQQQSYLDACSGRSYTRQGINRAGDVRVLRMLPLPITVQDGTVLIEDRVCQEGRPCP